MKMVEVILAFAHVMADWTDQMNAVKLLSVALPHHVHPIQIARVARIARQIRAAEILSVFHSVNARIQVAAERNWQYGICLKQ
jgi:hypothetical protein